MAVAGIGPCTQSSVPGVAMIATFTNRCIADAEGKNFDTETLRRAVRAVGQFAITRGCTFVSAPWDAPDARVKKLLRQQRRRLKREMTEAVYAELSIPGALIRMAAWVLPFLFPQYAALIKLASWVIDWAINQFEQQPATFAALCRAGGLLA